ncbi:DJ-1/PfpI family protein [uncultured Croceitalea sp.]|uniref:DJ-1/PfpI family protein n=1 Tax=uncultured Croceitalea sp. TaxID=1798908 RepID=UPI0033066E2E
MNRLIVLFAACLISFHSPARQLNGKPTIYVCPPCDLTCDTKEQDGPGTCSHCNMPLIKKEDVKTIAFYLQDRVEVLDFAGPMEVLSYAGFNVFTVSATAEPIKSQGILTVLPDYTIENAPKADILAFFGGNSNAPTKNPKVIEWVKNQNVEYHFSVCTGAFILAEAGILDGKTATTFHSALDNLEKSYPKIDVRRDVRYVDNGNIITTAGISAGIDGALHLVAKLQGLNSAKRIAYTMEYDNWQLGNGLLLTDEDPYKKQISLKELKTFEGTYEFEDNMYLQVVLNEKKGDLNAIVHGTTYPIYHEKGDVFSDVYKSMVTFKRNASNQIIGYQLKKDGPFFKKIE